MQILVLLGMYFDAVVVFVTSQTLLFRLALAVLCVVMSNAETPIRLLLVHESLSSLVSAKNAAPMLASSQLTNS